MSLHNGNAIYKDAFTSPEIYVFDEDYEKKHNTDNNVHSIFLEAGTRIYADDISMNTVASSAKFIQARYIPERRKFIKLPYVRARYYFENGNLLSISLHNKQLVKTEYLYMHFQMRKMRVDKKITPDCSIEILPDRFRVCKKIPTAIKEFKYLTVGFPYLFWVDVYKRKVRKKLQSKFK